MLTPPSPTTSPSLTPQDALNSRKRQRSLSSESLSSSSSAKRSMSQDPNIDIHETPRAKDMSALSISDANNDSDNDIDTYMAEQGRTSAEATTSTNPFTPQITLNATVAPPPSVDQFTPVQKLEHIKTLSNAPMRVGEMWYLVSTRWYKRWDRVCSGVANKEGVVEEKDLGPVDNTSLVDLRGEIVNPVVEHEDAEFVTEEAWNHLVTWYGSPLWPLPRKVISRGILAQPTLEIQPPRFYVHILLPSQSDDVLPPGETTRQVVLSCTDTISDLRRALITSHFPNSSQDISTYRIWKLDVSHEGREMHVTVADLKRIGATLLDDSEKTLEDISVENGDSFVIESKTGGRWLVNATEVPAEPVEGGSVPQSEQSTQETSEHVPLFGQGTDFFSQYQKNSDLAPSPCNRITLIPSQANLKSPAPIHAASSKDPRQMKINKPLPGTLGLGNMGNTCFMNSAIQCLAHTKELTDYFLTGVFEQELNTDNPLGMGGAIAEAFGQLLRRIWAPTTSNSSYSPREFKQVLQKFAPQFSGYQQHDSQELVAFLLDGLHEDLNRVLKKPYVEKPDWEGGGDKELVELARTSWDGYMKRNDSVIVDLFQGQYQSTLVCPECQKVSITFDPFMYLTVPLPFQKKWRHTISYIPWDLDKPHLEIPIEINSNATFKDLRALLGRWMKTNPDHLITVEIFSHKFYKSLDDNITCGEMAEGDVIACFELPCHSQQSRTYKKEEGDPFIVPVYLSESTPSRHRYGTTTSQNFGHPFFVPLTPEQATSVDAIYDAVVDRLQRWATNARDLHQWKGSSASTPMEEVPIPLEPSATLTEITENGEVVTVHESVPEEGDIVDQKSIVMEEQDDESHDDTSPRRVGFKRDLFTFRIQPSTQYSGGFGYTGSRIETWEQRIEKSKDQDTPILLRENDIFICEFDENLKAYFFGDKSSEDHATWTKFEEFIHPEYSASRDAATQQRKRGITLQDCLDEFTKEEQLGEDDLWYCPNCKKHQQATKRFDLWSVPDVLVVHLKRFSNIRSLRDKIDTLVEFPLTGLDLTPMVGERQVAKRLIEAGEDVEALGLHDVDEPLLYDLYAVDEHMGGLGGGHYRAYAHNDTNEKWYHFDDSYVTEAQASSSVTANAYLLFYKRRTSRPLGGKSHEKVEAARLQAESSLSTQADILMDTDPQPESQLPTPPVDTSDSQTEPPSESRTSWPAWSNANWAQSSSKTQSSPASTPPPLEDPPAFDDALNDPVVQSSLDLLPHSGEGITIELEQFEFPDPTSGGSPSSVRAEFDQDQDLDFDTDGSDDLPRQPQVFNVSVTETTNEDSSSDVDM